MIDVPSDSTSGDQPISLTFDSFITNQLQAVLWFEGYEPTARDVVRFTAGKWAAILDGDPVMLPNAAGLPPDLPRAIVPSLDGHWKMQVSARRVDLTWDQQVFQEVEAPKDFADIAQDCFSPLFELDGGLRVTRLAHVVRRHLLSDSPGRVLANYFVRKELRTPNGPLNRPEGFEFHAHKKYRPKTLPEINSWIRWRTGTLTNGDTPVVAVSQDLNTPADRDSSYSAKETGNFLRNAHAEADEILKLYLRFPIAD